MSSHQILQKYKPQSFSDKLNQRIVGSPFNAYGMPKNTRYSHLGLMDVGFLGRIGTPTAFDDTGLKAYYKFDEASGDIINLSESAVDLGSAADLQVTGATHGVTGILDDALSFDGVNDKAIAGTSLSQFNYMHGGTPKWTVAFWYKANNLPTGNEVIFNNNAVSATSGFNGAGSFFGASEELFVRISNFAAGGLIEFTSTTGYLPDATTFHFYVITWDQSLGSNNLTIKRDDANVENGTKTAGSPSSADASDPMTLGIQSGASATPLDGVLDEMSFWSKVMSDADQTKLFNSGAALAIY